MKMRLIMIAATPLLFTSCSLGKSDPYFDITADIRQHSTDENKGVHIVIYPVDRDGEAK